MKEQQRAAAASGVSSEVGEILVVAMGKAVGGSEIGKGLTAPVPSTGEDETSATKAARARTKEEVREAAGVTEPEEKKTEEPNTGSEEEGPAPDEETGKGGIGEGDDAESELPPEAGALGDISSRGDPGERRGASEEEGGRIPLEHTDRVSAPEGGTTERDDEYLPVPYERAADDIDRLLNKMAERAACEQLENERLRELNDAAQSISYGNIHSGVNIKVKRMASVDESYIEQYDRIAGSLLIISRQLQRSLIRQLKDSRRGGKQTGLLLGRRLDPHALHRNDGKVFYKNALPSEMPQLAVALLLDESGSMCSNARCTYARASAIILYDFCKSLEIPVMVYGHSTSGSSVALYSYAEFDSIDNDDRYRMMDISARENNRDGPAARHHQPLL